MKTLQTHYFNSTNTEVKVKTATGKTITVKPNTGIVSDFGDPFTKRKYYNTGWRKL